MKNQIGQFDTPEIIKQPKVERQMVESSVVSFEGPEGEIVLSELKAQMSSHFPEMSNRQVVEEIYAKEPVLPLAQEKNDPEKEEKKTVDNLKKYDRIREEIASVPLRQEVPVLAHQRVTKVVLTQDTAVMDREEVAKAVSKTRGLAQNTFGKRDYIDYLKSLFEKPDSKFGMEIRGKRLNDKLRQTFKDINETEKMQYERGVTGQGTHAFG